MQISSRIAGCISVVMTVFCLSACGGGDKQVSIQSGGMTHTFAEGDNSVPPDFPLPLYPEAKPTGSVSAATANASEDSKFLILASKDPMDKVGDFYQGKLKDDGWTVLNVQTLPKLTNISANKDQLDANVMLSSDGKQTTISLSVCRAAEDQTTSTDNEAPNKTVPATD